MRCAGLVCCLAVACSDAEPVAIPHVDSTIVASADVVGTIDPARTYEYDLLLTRVDSVLFALTAAGLAVEEAWWPLAYMCLDVRGPRLTVALIAPSARMADHDFQPGTGRLACSVELRQYVVRTPGP